MLRRHGRFCQCFSGAGRHVALHPRAFTSIYYLKRHLQSGLVQDESESVGSGASSQRVLEYAFKSGGVYEMAG